MTLYVVDTDILSLYQRNHPQVCTRIRLARQNNLVIKTTVITVEEQYGGRLAQIRKAQNPEALILAYVGVAYRRYSFDCNIFSILSVGSSEIRSIC
jgi:predicted nucleic acid-binding protein